MSTKSRAYRSTSGVQTQQRYWQRKQAATPWWPWGLLPLLGLVVLFLFGALITAPQIQAEVRQSVADNLSNAGVAARDVQSSGQGVSFEASASSDDKHVLGALAKSTQCETWAGKLDCPTTVAVRIAEPAMATAESVVRSHPFTVSRQNGTLTLTGEVPNLAEHDRILGVANAYFDVIDNRLVVSEEAATADYSRVADRALAVMSHLRHGQAHWSGESLSVDGLAAQNQLSAAKQEFDALGDDAARLTGDFSVRHQDGASSCNRQFDDVLRRAQIRFATGSATIEDGNDALLQQLAEIARSCPGSITIAGHTDSQGDAGMNQALSLARASAVLDALARLGIESDRLTAKGAGESDPIADNTTSAGRAQNRRIELLIEESK